MIEKLTILIKVSAPGYQTLVTQIFDRRDKYLKDDSVFAVKDSLIVDFAPRKNDPKAVFEVKYDFKLVRLGTTDRQAMNATTFQPFPSPALTL